MPSVVDIPGMGATDALKRGQAAASVRAVGGRRGTRAAPATGVVALTQWGKSMTALQVSAQKQLRQLVEQIERLEEEKKALAGDIRDKYLEAKAVGFDAKALRKIVSLRKKSQPTGRRRRRSSPSTCTRSA
jgi:uncharacterized protein (UPF0335 family)